MKLKTVAAMAIGFLLVSLSGACQSVPFDWSRGFTVGSDLAQSGGAGASFGTSSLSSDDYDSSDRATMPGRWLYIGTYHSSELDSQWTGPSGFYRWDYRAPIADGAGTAKTWVFSVWADLALPSEASLLILDFGYNSGIADGLALTLTLRAKPIGVTDGPAVGTVWDLSVPPYGVQLPVFRTSDGREGYVFDFTATVIPEPSSLLALFTGLAGLGLALRRRSRG